MNFEVGAEVDLGGLAPIVDLIQEATDMQLSAGLSGGVGFQDQEAGFGQGMNFGNKGDI